MKNLKRFLSDYETPTLPNYITKRNELSEYLDRNNNNNFESQIIYNSFE